LSRDWIEIMSRDPVDIMSQSDDSLTPSQDRLPQPELIEKIENIVAITLGLVPAVLRICLQYTFRHRKFLRLRLGTGHDRYSVPPYTFLAIIALTMTAVLGLTVTAFQIMLEDMFSGWTIVAPQLSEGRLRLARQIQMIQDNSLSAVLFTAAAIVIALAALARALANAMTTSSDHRSQIERLLCYVAGGQQVQMVLTFPVFIALFVLLIAVADFMSFIALALYLGYSFGWPAMTTFRALKQVVPLRSPASRVATGLTVALLAPAIVGVFAYATEAVPNALQRWRARILSRPAAIDYRIVFAQATIVEERTIVFTLAIQIVSGRPLVFDTERAYLAARDHPKRFWTQKLTFVDSSIGRVPLIVIAANETKWIRISAELSDNMRMEAITNYEWTSTLNCGDDEIALNEIPVSVEGATKRLFSP
jgi:hypothetical protein